MLTSKTEKETLCLMSLSDATTEIGIVTTSATNPSCSRAPVAWNFTLNPFDLKIYLLLFTIIYIYHLWYKETLKVMWVCLF